MGLAEGCEEGAPVGGLLREGGSVTEELAQGSESGGRVIGARAGDPLEGGEVVARETKAIGDLGRGVDESISAEPVAHQVR